jgi:hypothetical protein
MIGFITLDNVQKIHRIKINRVQRKLIPSNQMIGYIYV